jgi:ribonucleoside-diphosphate reductase alpha chain
MTDNQARSRLPRALVDYIFRWMGMEFIEGYREANAPRRAGSTKPEKKEETIAASSASRVKSATDTDAGKSSDRRDSKQDDRSGVSQGSETPAVSIKTKTSEPNGKPVSTNRIEKLEPRTTTEPTLALTPAGNGGGAGGTATAAATQSSLDQHTSKLMGDAPACDVCGSITVRNGTCYKCMNCGNSMGCS